MKFYFLSVTTVLLSFLTIGQTSGQSVNIQSAKIQQITPDSNQRKTALLEVGMELDKPYNGQKIQVISKTKKNTQVLGSFRIIEQQDGYYLSGDGIHQKLWKQQTVLHILLENKKRQKYFLTYTTSTKTTKRLKLIIS